VAFRQAAILWKDNHPRAKMERKTYLKKHFASEKEICDKLNALHAAYVRIYAAKGRKKDTLSAVQVLCEESGKAAERSYSGRSSCRISENAFAHKGGRNGEGRFTKPPKLNGTSVNL
jgi:hypothetical protein